MAVHPAVDGIAAQAGSAWVTGVRVIEVHARDVPGGCAVVIEACLRGMYPKEANLDSKRFFGVIPRRKALQVAQGLLYAYGVPQVPFEHLRM